MAQMNNYEGLVGVRSGSGVVSGLEMSITGGGTTLTVTAGTIKARFNSTSAEQKMNEGGAVVAVVATGSPFAAPATVGIHYFYAKADGTGLTMNDAGTQGTLSVGPIMNPALTAFKVSSGYVCLGSAECYSDAGVKKFRNIDYSRRETLA